MNDHCGCAYDKPLPDTPERILTDLIAELREMERAVIFPRATCANAADRAEARLLLTHLTPPAVSCSETTASERRILLDLIAELRGEEQWIVSRAYLAEKADRYEQRLREVQGE